MDGAAIADLLRARTYRFVDEDALQHLVDVVLRSAGVLVRREVRLTARDRIDLVAGEVGIEVKVAGSPDRVWSQLRRYAASPLVAELVLVTARLRLAHDPPDVGVPLYVVRVPDGIT